MAGVDDVDSKLMVRMVAGTVCSIPRLDSGNGLYSSSNPRLHVDVVLIFGFTIGMDKQRKGHV